MYRRNLQQPSLISYLDEHHPIKSFKVPDTKYPVFQHNVLKLIRKRRRALRDARRVALGVYNPHTAEAWRLMRKITNTMTTNRKDIILNELERHRKDPRKF